MSAQKQKVDREAVKTLAIAVGVREAARQLGLNEERVMKWSQRDHWLKQPEPNPLPPTVTRNEVRTVRKPSDALRNALADDNRKTRLGLSKGVRKAAEQISRYDGARVLKSSEKVRQIVQSAAQIHNWEGEKESGNGVVSPLTVYSKQTVFQVNTATTGV